MDAVEMYERYQARDDEKRALMRELREAFGSEPPQDPRSLEEPPDAEDAEDEVYERAER